VLRTLKHEVPAQMRETDDIRVRRDCGVEHVE
jgi:hypothetical protein